MPISLIDSLRASRGKASLKNWGYKFLSLTLAFTLSGCWGQRKARKIYHSNVKEAPFDAIIVTGIPYNGETWDDVMMLRVYWAKYLYDQGITKNIIFSGSAVYTKYYEAKVMKEYAVALGVPENVVYTETQAEHSTENVYYSLLMAYSLNFKKIALATDPYQSYFMRKVFKKKKKVKSLSYLPMDFSILEEMDKPEPEIDPALAIKTDFVPLTERESSRERWRGTMGKNVDFTKLK